MKRELILNIDGQEISLTATREGESIVVERDGLSYTVRIVAQSIVGMPSAVGQPTGSDANGVSGGVGRTGGGMRPTGAAAASRASEGAGSGGVVAPMTGVIDQVLVKEGELIAEGDKVVILEAMKMYIDVVAPTAGTVGSIAVKAGDSVKEGETLVTVQ